MLSLVEALNEWEIQLLVLLSFALQVFLFFTGGLRRRSISSLLRFSMWLAYLGADLVAVYALGFLSRHKDVTGKERLREAHPLAFLWAPFLLIHLGGQDTITAFAIQDNHLWLRHLLNLVVQVVVALYVFWVSMTGRDHRNLQLPGIFVFIAGIIKYGERTLALMYGNTKSSSTPSKKILKNSFKKESSSNSNISIRNEIDGYLGIVASALKSSPGIRELFAGHTLHQMEDHHREVLTSDIRVDHLPKLLEVELDLMYEDIYTKALVLRTMSGIIFRFLSQVSMVAGFVLFIVGEVNNKHRYNSADRAITYVLFTGGLCLEVCAVFIFLMSPWTWVWLNAPSRHWLARFSLFLPSCNFGRPDRRPLWSNSMGQYSFLSYVSSDHQLSLSKLVKKVTRKAMSLVVGAREETKSFLWMSKLLDTEYVEVDKEIMDSVVEMICRYRPGESIMNAQDQWPNLGALLAKLLPDFGASFGYGIVCFHIFTEAHLSKNVYPARDKVLVSACRKLSNYMLYLLVTHPEMLPVSGTTEPTLVFFLDKITKHGNFGGPGNTMNRTVEMLKELDLHELVGSSETLQELRDLWIKLLIYSAGKSRADMHAAQLSRGGELLTFAWLLMAHKKLGDAGDAFNFNFSFTKIGPWGKVSGKSLDVPTIPLRLETVTICSGVVVDSLAFSFVDQAGAQHTVGPWGGPGGGKNTIQLAPSETVKEISGTIGTFAEGNIEYNTIASLRIVTSVNIYGPYGTPSTVYIGTMQTQSTPFSVSMPEGGSIVGFFACAGKFVEALGVYTRSSVRN